MGSVTHQRFSSKSFITSGFFLKCGASWSPNSQRNGSAFRVFPTLKPTAQFHFLASTSPNGAHLWLNLHRLDQPGSQIPNTRWLARRLVISPIKPEQYLVKTFMNMNDTQLEVGKYLVSPLAKQQGEGRYAASVSIRSGRGSGTHDRVLRFNGLFDSAAAAVHYATEHALGWIHERSSPVCA